MTPPRVTLAFLVVALAAAGVSTIQPQLFGLHHDDGIYLTSAQSLADGAGYRLPSLPGRPAATKYQPLYPALVAGMLRVSPPFPASVLPLKLANVAGYAAALVLFFLLARRRLASEWSAVALCASLGMSPTVVTYLDYTMTESLFLVLVLAFLLAWDRTTGTPSPRIAGPALVTLLAVLATKAIGVVFGVAAVFDALRRRRTSLAAAVALVTTAWVVAWRWQQPAAGGSPLFEYYLGYEPSLLGLAVEHPAQGLRAIVDNLRYYHDGLGVAVGPAWSLLPMAALAAGGLVQRRREIDVWLVLCGVAVLMLYPGAVPRYLLPLVPIYLLAASECLQRLWHRWAMPGDGVAFALLLLAVPSAIPFAAFVRDPPSETFRQQRWNGYLETARWLRDHTPGDAVIASGNDQVYYLASGRRGIRPWRHNAMSYFHPRDKPTPRIGTPEEVRADLAAIGVSYVVVEPLNFHREGRAVEAMLRRLVTLPPAATPVFTNDHGRRVVYRLP